MYSHVECGRIGGRLPTCVLPCVSPLLTPKVIPSPLQSPKLWVALRGRPCLCPQAFLRPSSHNTNTVSMSSLASYQWSDCGLAVSLKPCVTRNGHSLCNWDCSSCSAVGPSPILHCSPPMVAVSVQQEYRQHWGRINSRNAVMMAQRVQEKTWLIDVLFYLCAIKLRAGNTFNMTSK